MTEDISAYIRFSVSISLLAALLSTVVTISAVSFSALNILTQRYDEVVHVSDANILKQLAGERVVSGPMLYRLISQTEGMLYTCKVTDAGGSTVYNKDSSGTITGTLNYLVRNGDFNYNLNLQYSNGSGYMLEASEERLLTGDART